MLNFDMVGSPNYVRFVYDGDNSGVGIERSPDGGHRILVDNRIRGCTGFDLSENRSGEAGRGPRMPR